jgi:hypothetical protein
MTPTCLLLLLLFLFFSGLATALTRLQYSTDLLKGLHGHGLRRPRNHYNRQRRAQRLEESRM